MTNKQIEHLISNWENACIDTIACIPSGDKLVDTIRYLQNYSDNMPNLLLKIKAEDK